MPKKIPAQKAIDYLHPNELWLIKKIRQKYRFGEITIIIRNGVPLRIKKGYLDDDPRNNELTFEI